MQRVPKGFPFSPLRFEISSLTSKTENMRYASRGCCCSLCSYSSCPRVFAPFRATPSAPRAPANGPRSIHRRLSHATSARECASGVPVSISSGCISGTPLEDCSLVNIFPSSMLLLELTLLWLLYCTVLTVMHCTVFTVMHCTSCTALCQRENHEHWKYTRVWHVLPRKHTRDWFGHVTESPMYVSKLCDCTVMEWTACPVCAHVFRGFPGVGVSMVLPTPTVEPAWLLENLDQVKVLTKNLRRKNEIRVHRKVL